MLVKELSEKLHTTLDTVRFYTRKGLLNPVKGINGYKFYSGEDLHRLKFIISARELGFTVKDITLIINHSSHHQSACPLVRDIIQRRLEQTRVKFQQVKMLRNRMEKAIEIWDTLPDQAPDSDMICHLIESFDSEQSGFKDKLGEIQ